MTVTIVPALDEKSPAVSSLCVGARVNYAREDRKD